MGFLNVRTLQGENDVSPCQYTPGGGNLHFLLKLPLWLSLRNQYEPNVEWAERKPRSLHWKPIYKEKHELIVSFESAINFKVLSTGATSFETNAQGTEISNTISVNTLLAKCSQESLEICIDSGNLIVSACCSNGSKCNEGDKNHQGQKSTSWFTSPSSISCQFIISKQLSQSISVYFIF